MIVRLVKFAYGNARARALLADFWGLKQLKTLVESGDRAGLLKLLEEYCPGETISLENADSLLTENYVRLGAEVAKSLPAKEGQLIRAYIRRIDSENLKILARGLFFRKRPERYRPLLTSCQRAGGIPLERLQAVESFTEFGALLPSDPRLQSAFTVLQNEPGANDLLRFEFCLEQIFWQQLADRIRKLRIQDRQAAESILGMRADLERFNLLHRGWRSGIDPELLADFLPPLGEVYGGEARRRIFKSSKPDQQIAKYFPLHDIDHPLGPDGEVALLRRLHSRLRSILTEPPFDISLPLAAVLFKELEKQDLQVLASGIRTGQPPQRMKSLLVTMEG